MTSSRAGRRGPALAAVASGLLVSLAPCCNAYDPGIAVQVGLLHHFAAQGTTLPEVHASGELRSFTTDVGYQIQLDRGYVVAQAVELEACADPDAGAGAAAGAGAITTRLWRGLAGSGVAHAHDLSGKAFRLGVPSVDDLMRADDSVFQVGTIAPPPGRYCGAKVVIGPADRDAEGLPGDIDMVGRSLYLEGRFRAADSTGSWRPFRVDSSEVQEVQVELVTIQHGEPTPVVLDSDHLDVSIVIGMDYNLWLDGVDLGGAGPDQLVAGVFANLGRTIHYHPVLTQ